MSGINERLFGQLSQTIHRVVEHRGQLVGGDTDRSQQVGPTDIANEQRVAGENGLRFEVALCQVVNQQRDAFGSVTWRLHDFQADVAELDDVAVFDGVEVVLRFGSGSEINVSPGLLSQLDVTGEEVRMEVRQEDVLNLPAICLSVVEVLLNVPLRIDDGRNPRAFISNHVGRV